MDEITKALENGEIAVGVFLDFSKAFDTVNHEILLSKLDHYGIRNNALSWLKSYLTNRRQFVSYNGYKSEERVITCGVPQGSILGPLLFLIYINDLSKICQHTMPFLFADDTNLNHHHKDPITLQDEINADLKKISEWLKVNRLSLNIKKTHFMIFTNRNVSIDLKLSIDNIEIDCTDQTKFLGVIIDHKLNWSKHISHISSKVSRGLGIIIKARKCLPKDAILSLYYSFIYPYLTYCNIVWGTACASHLDKLKILQKRAIRIIGGVKPREHTAPLYRKFNLLSLHEINKFMVGRFMFKVFTCQIIHTIQDLFKRNRDVHSHNTRQSTNYHLPKVHTNLGKKGIRFHGAIIWNKIMNIGIPYDCSEAVFNISLKKALITDQIPESF